MTGDVVIVRVEVAEEGRAHERDLAWPQGERRQSGSDARGEAQVEVRRPHDRRKVLQEQSLARLRLPQVDFRTQALGEVDPHEEHDRVLRIAAHDADREVDHARGLLGSGGEVGAFENPAAQGERGKPSARPGIPTGHGCRGRARSLRLTRNAAAVMPRAPAQRSRSVGSTRAPYPSSASPGGLRSADRSGPPRAPCEIASPPAACRRRGPNPVAKKLGRLRPSSP